MEVWVAQVGTRVGTEMRSGVCVEVGVEGGVDVCEMAGIRGGLRARWA